VRRGQRLVCLIHPGHRHPVELLAPILHAVDRRLERGELAVGFLRRLDLTGFDPRVGPLEAVGIRTESLPDLAERPLVVFRQIELARGRDVFVERRLGGIPFLLVRRAHPCVAYVDEHVLFEAPLIQDQLPDDGGRLRELYVVGNGPMRVRKQRLNAECTYARVGNQECRHQTEAAGQTTHNRQSTQFTHVRVRIPLIWRSFESPRLEYLCIWNEASDPGTQRGGCRHGLFSRPRARAMQHDVMAGEVRRARSAGGVLNGQFWVGYLQ
jgi:hypothetical protein